MKKILAVVLVIFILNSVSAIIIKAPAVSLTNRGYVGVPISIEIDVKKGDGQVFMDTLPLTELDMQGSARIAAKVAGEVTGKDMSKYNVYITVRSDVPVVGGPSAGGTMTIGIICDLMNWSLNKHVMMTGMINPDGSIGPVGGILEKIEAAKEANCTIMLIPKGQRYVEVDGSKVDAVEFGKKLGVKVIEVGSIYEAIPYFTGKKITMKEYPENPEIEKKYKNIMKKLCERIVSKANEKYNNISKDLSSSYVGYEYQRMLLEDLKSSKELIDKANNEYMNGEYYPATCYAFNALIKLETIDHTLKYLTGEENVKTFLTNVQNKISQEKNIVYSKNVTTNDFQEVLAGRIRIAEAEKLMYNAWKSYYLGNYDDAIKYGSFAKLRGESAIWWISLNNENNGKIINVSKLKPLAQQYLDNAETISTYVETVFPNLPADELEKDLESAKQAYNNGDYLLTIAESIDTCVKAEVPLVIFGDIDYSKKYARNKINLAESLGITPVLALGYYNYANTLNNTVSKAMYYKYSSYYAQMDIDVISCLNKTVNKNIHELTTISSNNSKSSSENITSAGSTGNNNIGSIISGLIGAAVGFAGGYMTRKVLS